MRIQSYLIILHNFIIILLRNNEKKKCTVTYLVCGKTYILLDKTTY